MVAIAVPAQPGAAVLGSLSPAAIEGGNHNLAHVRGAIGGSMSPAANGGNQTFVHLGKKEEREREEVEKKRGDAPKRGGGEV